MKIANSLLAYLKEEKEQYEKNDESNLVEIDEFIKKMTRFKTDAEEIYFPRIEKMYPFHTDHGRIHVEQVHRMISKMLYRYKSNMSAVELFILYVAIYFHDVGMSRKRTGHEKEAYEILEGYTNILGNVTLRKIITEIVKAHSGDFTNLESLSTSAEISYGTLQEKIDVRALASLLRFADEVSETNARIDSVLLAEDRRKPEDDEYRRIPKENLVFWEYANCIKYSQAEWQDRKIEMSVGIINKIFYKEFEIPQKDGNSKKQMFIDYFLERLDKMDKERRICCANFRHMISIDTIEIKIKIVDDNEFPIESIDPIEINLNEQYFDRNSLEEAFYDKHPEIKDRENFEKRIMGGTSS